jgi:O-antigen/teichoic acid export membrane protein
MILFTVLVARYMGEEVLGQYAFIASIIFIGNVATTFGMDTLLIREVAAGRNQQVSSRAAINATLTTALAIQLTLAAIIILAVWLGAEQLANQTADTLAPFRLASLALLPLAFSTVYSAYLRGYERMDLYMLFNLITALWMVGGMMILIQRRGGLLDLAVLLLSSHVAGAGMAALFCHRSLPSLSFRRQTIKQQRIVPMLKIGFVLGALTALAVIYQRVGTLTLSLLVDDVATGWYSAAARITEAVKIVPYALFGAMFPIMARQAARRSVHTLSLDLSPTLHASAPVPRSFRPAGRGLYDLSFLMLLAFAGCASITLMLFAGPLIGLLYGPGYEPSVSALTILAWSLLPAVITLRLSFDLVTSGRERIALAATAITLAATIVITGILTRRYGLQGTCAAVVGCEALQACILFLFARYRQ